VRGHPLGDVGHRQVGHDLLSGRVVAGPLERREQTLRGPGEVVVRQHHPLGVAGRARGVDDRGEVVGGADLGGFDEVGRLRVGEDLVAEHPVGNRRRGHDGHDVLEGRQLAAHLEELVEEACVLHDGHLGPAMAGEVGHLVGGRGVVDRDRGGATEQHGEVGPVELGDVAHHDDHPVVLAHTQGPEPGGGPRHLLGELVEGELAPLVVGHHPADGHLRAVLGHRREELPGDGAPLDHRVDVVRGQRRHWEPPAARSAEPRNAATCARVAVTVTAADGPGDPIRGPALTRRGAPAQNLDRSV
jgi:hypothetical protein